MARTRAALARQPGWPFWVHLDVDVLDRTVMPAVDSPGSPGIDPEILTFILRGLLGEAACAGLTVTVFDPDLDPEGRCAGFLVGLLGEALATGQAPTFKET